MDDRQDTHFGYAVDLAKEALKGLLLVNGGAATALLALADKAESAKAFGNSILCFGVGALIAVAAMVAAYFSQLEFAKNEQEKHEWRQSFAIVLVLLSLSASGLGFWLAFQAIDVLSDSNHAVY